MKLKSLFIILVYILSLSKTIAAKQNELDKLEQQIASAKEDTVKVNLLLKYSSGVMNTDPKKGNQYAQKALDLANKIDYEKGVAESYHNLGVGNRLSGKYDQGIEYLNFSKAQYSQMKDAKGVGKVLNALGVIYRKKGDYNKAKDLLDLSIQTLKEANDPLGLAKAYNDISNVYSSINQKEKSISIKKKALAIADSLGEYILKGTILMNIGNDYLRMNKYEQAIKHYKTALPIQQEQNNLRGISKLYSNLSLTLTKKGDYVESLNIGQKALKIKEQLKDTVGIGNTLINIGNIYNNLGDYRKALYHHKKAAKISNEKGNKLGYAVATNSIAANYLLLDSLDKSLYYHRLTYKLFEKLHKCYLIYAENGLGDCFYKLNQLDSARYYFDVSLKGGKSCRSEAIMGGALSGLGEVALKEKKYNQAEKYLIQAYAIAEKTGEKDTKRKVSYSLYKVYKKKNLYQKALKYHEVFQQTKDSIFNDKKTKEITLLEAEFAFEKEKQQIVFEQEKEKLKLEEEKRILNTQQIATFIGFGVFLIMSALLARAYKEKLKVNQKLYQLDAFKTRLFANINHDFRTPLTLINGYISRIIKNEDNYLTGETEVDLVNLENNTRVLIDMTEEIQNLLLLEESKLKLKFNKVDIKEYLKTIVLMFASAAELGKINLTFESSISDNQLIHIDKYHFEKIIYNLLSNAFRYTTSGDQISVFLSSDENDINIKIKDTGQGIRPDDINHIFDRFYQSLNQEYHTKEGFGIGLAVVRELINLHQGDIGVESQLGEGTTFIISLPFNLDKPLAEEEKIISGSTKTKASIPKENAKNTAIDFTTPRKEDKTHKILVVDDHEEIRRYIIDILKPNYTVIEASNGKQALKLLEKDKPDLILTDLMMPWLDGYEFIDKLNEHEIYKDIPIMVVSARTSDKDKHKVLDQGINEFLSKPFDADELEKRISNILVQKKSKQVSWDQIVNDKSTHSNIEQNIHKQLNQIILDRIDDPELTIDLIASELCASRSKTIRLIKKITDKTPLAYIKSIRLDYVSHLIKEEKVKNNSAAAKAIGMKNATDFSKQYQKYFGEVPFE